MPVAKRLFDVEWEKSWSWCYLIRDDGGLGRVTFMSLMHTAMGHYPFSETRTGFTEAQVRGAKNSKDIAELLLSYALKHANGDVARARAYIDQAERYDSYCLQRHAQQIQAEVRLLRQNLQMELDADGKWVVFKIDAKTVQGIAPILQDQGRQTLYWAGWAGEGYGLADRLLAQRGATSNRAVEKGASQPWNTTVQRQPRRDDTLASPVAKPSAPAVSAAKVPAPSAKAETIRDAQRELQAAIDQARQMCLTVASAKCG